MVVCVDVLKYSYSPWSTRLTDLGLAEHFAVCRLVKDWPTHKELHTTNIVIDFPCLAKFKDVL
jgi:hypothetical protein